MQLQSNIYCNKIVQFFFQKFEEEINSRLRRHVEPVCNCPIGTKGEPGERGKLNQTVFYHTFTTPLLTVRINRWIKSTQFLIFLQLNLWTLFMVLFLEIWKTDSCTDLYNSRIYTTYTIALISNLSAWSDGLCWFWRLWANIVTAFVTACDSVKLHKNNDRLILSNYTFLSFLILSKNQIEN